MEEIKSSEEIFGGRLLREMEESEESLESLLATLTNTLTPQPPKTHIHSLDTLWSQQNQPKLLVSGRQLPLLIHILTALLKVGKAVVLIDIHSRFSPSFLPFQDDDEYEDVNNEEGGKEEEGRLKKSDLKHLHIFRPSSRNLECTLKGIEEYMLYGEHESYGREFGGTIFFGFDARDTGGSGSGVANVRGMGRPEIWMGWRGWLRVEREEVAGFGAGVSAEEILAERESRVEVIMGKGWKGRGEKGGEIVWKLE